MVPEEPSGRRTKRRRCERDQATVGIGSEAGNATIERRDVIVPPQRYVRQIVGCEPLDFLVNHASPDRIDRAIAGLDQLIHLRI
jgi:hypothetical protein